MPLKKWEIIKGALISAIFGFTISFALNYWLIPVPETELANAIGTGISGFMSGFIGAFMTSLTQKKAE